MAKLLPDVLTDANSLMSALLEYGKTINDWSMRSAVIQNGYRPDDESQGRTYLRIIKDTIANNSKIFGTAKFPESLNDEAQGVLGRRGDARRTAFQRRVAEAPGWSRQLAQQLFQIVDNAYAPRGSNPHATGLVFDLDFSIYHNGGEIQLGAATSTTALPCKAPPGCGPINTPCSLALIYTIPARKFGIWNTENRSWHNCAH